MDAKMRAVLEVHFTSEEVVQMEAFLDRGFSENGQIVVANIFLFGRENQKSVTDVLIECEKEWERNWQYQHPDIKGDPDAPGGAGIKNRTSLENVSSALGISPPSQ